MSTYRGKFVWYDLMTTDIDAGKAFYESVIGWDINDAGMGDEPYLILSLGPRMIGGMMPIPEMAVARGVKQAAWRGYIAVDDVDDYAKRVTAAGGELCFGPEDIPMVGRFAVVNDPHGATFILFRGDGEPPSSLGEKSDTPGTIGWHELQAGDLEADFKFYSGLFNWTKDKAYDMGPIGQYQLFAVQGVPVGGIMTKPAEMPGPPRWRYIFNVDAIDAAKARVEKAGGTVTSGPDEVPGGQWVINCIDPQGADFGLVASKR